MKRIKLTEVQKSMIEDRMNDFLNHADVLPTQDFLDSLYEGFAELSSESLRLQKINRVMTGLTIVGVVLALIVADLKIVAVVLGVYILANFFVGWQHSRMATKKLRWPFEKQRAAMDLVTEPEWQHELKSSGSEMS